MKADTNRRITPLASLSLTIAGIIMILASLIDYVVLIFLSDLPDQASNLEFLQGQLNLVTQIADRGIIPLIGLAFILTGSWINSNSGNPPTRPPLWKDLRFWALLLSSLLGLVFAVLALLHVNNTRLAYSRTLEQINQEVSQAGTELDTRLTAEVGQQRTQINQLLQNETQLNQAIESGQVPAEQADLLQQFRNDPDSLDQYLEERAGQFRQQLEFQIRNRELVARRTARNTAVGSAVRIGTSSLLLAIGYIIIGWTGLKRLLTQSSSSPR